MFRQIRPPFLARKYFPGLVWRVNTVEKDLYLTFDDGPTPEVTDSVLDMLKKHDAKATFFCLGKNIKKYPEIYQRILKEGHAVGNHTTHHLNGWATHPQKYLEDIAASEEWIQTKLFRPPYGRITKEQIKRVSQKFKIIMWDVLSWDFDSSVSASKVARNVCAQSRPGSIIVFHDSVKARKNVEQALPAVLRFFCAKGYSFRTLQNL